MKALLVLFTLFIFNSCSHASYKNLSPINGWKYKRKIPLLVWIDPAIADNYQENLSAALTTWNNIGGCTILKSTKNLHEATVKLVEAPLLKVGTVADHMITKQGYSRIRLFSVQDKNIFQKNTLIHELGHALGLNHSIKGYIMYKYVPEREATIHQYNQIAVRSRYCGQNL